MEGHAASEDRNREARLRRLAKQKGLALRRSRARTPNIDDRGGYMVVNPGRNFVVHGERFDLTLDDVAGLLDN
jgi:hypothetical protein